MSKTTIMKKIIYFILIVEISSCTLKENNIKRFDIAAFKKHKQFTMDDTLISMSVHDKFYLEEKRALKDSMVVVRNTYLKYDRTLFGSMKVIYNKAAPIYLDVMKNYDSNGNLIKQHDFDKGFEYSIVDLIKKVKSDCNMQIDTMRKTYYINRDNKNKLYLVKYTITMNDGSYYPYEIIFDGTT
ncbi:hypothetical protein [Flavobacterium sp.]|uniref:hypothetical protein n=1 Tax=Flavobacterium sp. TaxID=239 RepID=UPI00248A45F7|nr:hypothetical protein [Flavobacterium sp.]MDI1317793.1 hypothetical protein [Flavobacterium sp.]